MVFEKLKAILSQQFDVLEETITLDTNLLQDLNADSLDIADLISTIEDEFDITVDETQVESISTVEDIVEVINKFLI